MRKLIFILLFAVLGTGFSLASETKPEVKEVEVFILINKPPINSIFINYVNEITTTKNITILSENNYAGRECCRATGINSRGERIIITACAGWFLSNSDNAYSRACDKAYKALISELSQ